ncbi:MAG: CPBP family intramembrane metalloprotease [Sedimentisphaerales bacterium]|nr:CPBP family intramembrane metalloprotease [Sedimentisphaerales bacterium]
MEQASNKTSGKSLLIEIIVITIISIGVSKLLQVGFSDNQTLMALAVPVILISAAIIPTIVRRKDLCQIGFRIGDFRRQLKVLFAAFVIVFSALVAGVLLLDHYKVQLPMRPIIPEGRLYIWFCYQILFVAIPEEVFFRGYLQSNIIYLFNTVTGKKFRFLEWYGIIICAIVFAVSHVILLGSIISIITFLPGLIMGWLFFRTNSLIAPILFHSIANIGYGIIATVIA